VPRFSSVRRVVGGVKTATERFLGPITEGSFLGLHDDRHRRRHVCDNRDLREQPISPQNYNSSLSGRSASVKSAVRIRGMSVNAESFFTHDIANCIKQPTDVIGLIHESFRLRFHGFRNLAW
jgi:hypothetical protein